MQAFSFDEIQELDLSELEQPWEPPVKAPDKPEAMPADLLYSRTPTIRSFADYRTNPDAYRHLARLPEPGETHHGLISGRYGLFDLIPATLERLGKDGTIDELWLSSLSFSKHNARDLLDFLDLGKVAKVWVVVGDVFRAKNPQLYNALAPYLLAKGHAIAAVRTHAKIIAMATGDGRHLVAESSANLRSCNNVEQFTMTHDRQLYDFHRQWIEGFLKAPSE